jgi:hypothetical protein
VGTCTVFKLWLDVTHRRVVEDSRLAIAQCKNLKQTRIMTCMNYMIEIVEDTPEYNDEMTRVYRTPLASVNKLDVMAVSDSQHVFERDFDKEHLQNRTNPLENQVIDGYGRTVETPKKEVEEKVNSKRPGVKVNVTRSTESSEESKVNPVLNNVTKQQSSNKKVILTGNMAKFECGGGDEKERDNSKSCN